MTNSVEELVRQARAAGKPAGREMLRELSEAAARMLHPLYRLADGFHAFNSALHVMSVGEMRRWNDPSLWRHLYEDLIDEKLLFFAEDIFGGQFCIGEKGFGYLDPETAKIDELGETAEEWARELLADHEVLVGTELAARWQAVHGPLKPNERLVPRTFFVLGGPYELENLISLPSDKGMRIRAAIAIKLRDVPDGTSVELKVVD